MTTTGNLNQKVGRQTEREHTDLKGEVMEVEENTENRLRRLELRVPGPPVLGS